MAFPGISAGQGRQPAAQAGARARLLLVTALAVFAGVTVYGLWRRQLAASCCETDTNATQENT